MSRSEEWRALAVHREAGLAGQLNIETVASQTAKALPWMEIFSKEFDR